MQNHITPSTAKIDKTVNTQNNHYIGFTAHLDYQAWGQGHIKRPVESGQYDLPGVDIPQGE